MSFIVGLGIGFVGYIIIHFTILAIKKNKDNNTSD